MRATPKPSPSIRGKALSISYAWRGARGFLGGEPGPLRVGRDPVNLPMVHHWCQALDDHNPAYLDEAYAVASSRGQLVAPPGMLQTWTMDAPRDPAALGANDEVMKRLDHSMIFILIAGTYTPFALLLLEGRARWLVFGLVWGGALAGVVLRNTIRRPARWLFVGIYAAGAFAWGFVTFRRPLGEKPAP